VSVTLSVCPTLLHLVCLSVCLSLCLSVRLSVCVSNQPLVCDPPRYVQKALVELLSVVLDIRQWDSKGCRGEPPNTGGWECIHRGVQMETPVAAFGTDMTLKGQAMKLPRKVNASLVAGQGAGAGSCVVNHNINSNSGNSGSRNQIPSANTSTRAGNSQRTKERSSKKIVSDSDDEDEESEEESGTYSGPSHPRSSGIENFTTPLRDRDSPGKMRGRRRSLELCVSSSCPLFLSPLLVPSSCPLFLSPLLVSSSLFTISYSPP
jgi:hypothetical protein